MADHPEAMADLRALLAAREPLYASADYTINTSGRSTKVIVDEVASKAEAAL
jgi:shikimate kinase